MYGVENGLRLKPLPFRRDQPLLAERALRSQGFVCEGTALAVKIWLLEGEASFEPSKMTIFELTRRFALQI